jgi:hypothetical protein
MERKEAKLLGHTTYLTGVPCKNGHVAYRYTMSGSCSQCINGTRKGGDSETFLKRANELRMTALLAYNEGLKSITQHYETALANATKLELRAAELRAINDETQRKVTLHALDHDRMLRAKQEERERKESVRKMIKQNVFIHPDDVFEAKTYLLERAQSVCPHITADDVSYKRKVQGGVLHEIRCFPEHQDEILTATNKAYNARNVAIKPQS